MEIIQRPTIEVNQIEENRAEFKITPLEPGFGYTVGNSLRRVLMSSIPGAAITSIKIDGAKHEFQAIEGIKEDVTQIVQNIKGIVVSSVIDEPIAVFIQKDKPGEVTAADIEVASGIEVLNKEHHICTLSKGKLQMELVIERGRGYVPAEINKRQHANNLEVGRIAVDSIYSPVLNVKYKPEATRVGELTNFDSLTIEVTTKSSISPVDALASAGKTLIELFGLVRDLNVNAEGLNLPSEENGFLSLNNSISNDSSDSLVGISSDVMLLEDFEINSSTLSVLKENSINTLSDLLTHSAASLKKLDKIGPQKIKQIEDVLSASGYSLAKN